MANETLYSPGGASTVKGSSNRSPLNSDNICDSFWMKKRQQKLNETIKRRKVHRILNDWNKGRILRESNQTFLRNKSREHGIFFGKVVYEEDFLRRKMVSPEKFVDCREDFRKFANCAEE